MNNPAIKRLAKELKEIQNFEVDSDEVFPVGEDFIEAAPLADDLFEWHFTLKGPLDSDYTGGLYHGRVMFPSDYPFSPPSISFLTPNGRWEIEKKICLSVTGFHPEMWQPAWGIRTILLALRDHFGVEDRAAIGYLDYPAETRKELARKSKVWKCKNCPYDASLRKSTDTTCYPPCNNDTSKDGILWNIGIFLLILSISISYIYIYLI